MKKLSASDPLRQTIQKSGERMLNTINSIVDISKIESGLMDVEIKQSKINGQTEFLHKFFKPAFENKGLKLSYKNGLPSEEATINTDQEKLYAILTNLIKNALKFTNKGSVDFGYERKGNYLEFFVKDTGNGIPQTKGKLFLNDSDREVNPLAETMRAPV